MSRHHLKQLILLTVVCLWTGESGFLLASELCGAPNICSSELDQEFEHDDLETKGLQVNVSTCVVESVTFGQPTDHETFLAEMHSVFRWHLRGPPLG